MAASRLILPVLLALLSGACADTGASLRDALRAGGQATAPSETWQTTDRTVASVDTSDRKADERLAPRIATRSFFVAEPLHAGAPLPDAPIPRAEFPEIQLSDALLYLLRNVTLQLAVDDNLDDKTLNSVVLEGDFADALAQLAQKGNFFYHRKGDVLSITSAARYRVTLPPVGYVGAKGHKDAVLALDPFATLKDRLQKAGARNVQYVSKANELVFETSVAGRTPVLEALAAFRRDTELTAWKLAVLRLKPGPLVGKTWATFSPDLHPVPLEGRPGDVRAYAGRFDATAIATFLKALKQDSVLLEKGVVLLPENFPVSFTPATSLCPASKMRGKGGKTPAAATLTLQTRRDDRNLRTNLTALLPGCTVADTSMALTAPASQKLALVGVGGDLVLILEPQRIRFASAED
jgi:hypothetical protein